MKKFRFIFIIVCFSIIIFNCKKTNDVKLEKYFIDFHETILGYNNYYQWPPVQTEYYDIDIDKDSLTDITIFVSSNFGHDSGPTYTEGFIQVTPKNGIEMAFTNYIDKTWSWNPSTNDTTYYYKTVQLTKVFKLNDTIKFEDNFTDSSLFISYSYTRNPITYNSNDEYGLKPNGLIYLAFRSGDVNNSKLGWLKVEVKGSSTIILNSCMYVVNENLLVIK